MEIIKLEDKGIPGITIGDGLLANLKQLEQIRSQAEEVHRVEFINWKTYTVCNVMINEVWRTCSFPASTTVIEFLMDGLINKCVHWPQGRNYTNQ